jgi:hypothetical protein
MLDRILKKTLKKISSIATISEHYMKIQFDSAEQNNCNQNEQALNKKYLQNNKPVHPTVLWTGNGYHIYLPIQAIILDGQDLFYKDEYPNLFLNYNCKYSNYSVSDLFLKFAENFFIDGKADLLHRLEYNTVW